MLQLIVHTEQQQNFKAFFFIDHKFFSSIGRSATARTRLADLAKELKSFMSKRDAIRLDQLFKSMQEQSTIVCTLHQPQQSMQNNYNTNNENNNNYFIILGNSTVRYQRGP